MSTPILTRVSRSFDPVIIIGGKAKPLTHYTVSLAGAKRGWVGQRMERQEKKVPGHRIVASSWESKRWYYEVEGQPGKRFGGYDTRAQAVQALLLNIRIR